MDHAPDLDAVAEAVMAAHAVVERHGTRAMRAMSRTLLRMVGREISRRGVPLRGAVDPGLDDARPTKSFTPRA